MVRLGRSVRVLRGRRRWRQDDLAEASGTSQSSTSRIELGQGDRVTIRALESVLHALGAQLDVRARWGGEALDRLLDAAHAALVEAVVRRLRSYGWAVEAEVSFSIRGERGSIDVFGWDRATGDVLVVEVKSVVPDQGATLMVLDRKARLAPLIARDRGIEALRVSRLLVIADDRTARRRIAEHAATYLAMFPVRARAVMAWLGDGARRSGPISGLAFLPLTRHTGGRPGRRVRPGRAGSGSRSMTGSSRPPQSPNSV